MEKKEKVEKNDPLEMVNKVGIEKLNKGLDVTIKIICIPIIIITLGIAIFSFYCIGSYFDSIMQSFHVDILKTLKTTYGENFQILSQQTDSLGNGSYRIAPKKTKEIVFTAYVQGGNYAEDYQEHCIKYIVENNENRELTAFFQKQETTREEKTIKGKPLLQYQLYKEIEDYTQIENCCKKMWEITQKVKERYPFCKVFTYIKQGEYKSNVSYENDLSLEELIRVQKYQYIQYFKNKDWKTNKIPEEDRKKMDIPETLDFWINGIKIKNTNPFARYNNIVTFNPAIQEYEIWLPDLIKNVTTIEKVEYGNKIKYQGKYYDLNLENNKWEKGKIPYHCRMSYLEQIFGAKIQYFVEEGKIDISI